MNILLADDDAKMLSLLQEYLEQEGFTVQGAEDGNQALALFQQGVFPVAVLDLVMPGLTGLELLSRFKEFSPDTEVIILTGQADLESAIEAMRRGAYDYLIKPVIHLENLRAVISRALERQRLSQANKTLIGELTAAQGQLAEQRRVELKLLRRIGEGLAGALELDRIIDLLLDLIWENIPLSLLGLYLCGIGSLPAKLACRHQENLPDKIVQDFESHLQTEMISVCREILPGDTSPGLQNICQDELCSSPPPSNLIHSAIWTPLWLNHELAGVLTGCRETPFISEERELFRIIALQATAALKNLELFAQMKFMAQRDGLTGLYNQRHFWEVFHDEVNRSNRYHLPLSLLFIDLDRFKSINDSYGHPVGDEILQSVSALMQHTVRQTDLIFRYGGEEFVIVLPQTPKKKAVILAERLREEVAASPLKLSGMEIQVTISVGVASLKGSLTAEKMVQLADDAMYRAKQTGRNQVAVA
jgi:diguanylate cyclase (GGDEF)-like protein